MASFQVLDDELVKSKPTPRDSTTEDDQSQVLSSVLNVMRNHLDFEEIGMWMVQEEVVTLSEYEESIHDRILIATQNGQMPRSRAVTLLAGIVQKKGTFKEFMSALRLSSVKVSSHDLIVKAIEDQLKSQFGDDVVKDDVAQPGKLKKPLIGDEREDPPEGRKPLGLLARLILLLMVPVFATVGIIFIVYSVRGFIGHETCRITEEFALEAFSFIFGLLCLAVPIVFVLLVIISTYSMLREKFETLWCTSQRCQNKLIGFTMLFIIAVFILAIVELIYSIYVAVQTYGHFNDWMNEFDQPPSARRLNCTRAVFISTFASLTIYYILAFFGFCTMFVFLIGPWIKMQIQDIYRVYMNHFVKNTLLCCCEHDTDGTQPHVSNTQAVPRPQRGRHSSGNASEALTAV